MRKCINCPWIGEDKEVIMPLKYCPVCGDRTEDIEEEGNLEKIIEEPDKIDLDLNDDGVVDSKDRSIAARFLGSKRGRKKKR